MPTIVPALDEKLLRACQKRQVSRVMSRGCYPFPMAILLPVDEPRGINVRRALLVKLVLNTVNFIHPVIVDGRVLRETRESRFMN